MSYIQAIASKIVSIQQLRDHLARIRSKKQRIVFTNGCFDLVHKGHIDYLAKAKDLGDILILGLNTDNSIQRIKGPTRPVQKQDARATIIAAFEFIDYVVLFDEDTPYELIKEVQPDVLVKGADYKPEDIVGYDIVMEKGGEIKTLEFLPGHSTSLIIEKINKGYVG